MAKSDYVDERVARISIDNDQFEKGAEKTLGTIDKLNEALKFKGAKKAIDAPDTSGIDKVVSTIEKKFSALEVLGRRVVENIGDSLTNIAKQVVIGADQITPGYNKYEQQVQYIQKLINSTKLSMDEVQKISDKILWYTNETSYEYTSMMKTIGDFTSAGMNADEAVRMILGLGNEAAMAGANATEATHAFTGFSRAIAQGYMSSNNWEWVKTAGMNIHEFQQILIDAAVAEGTLIKASEGVYHTLDKTPTVVTAENMGSTLGQKWLTSNAIKSALSKYSVALDQMYDMSQEGLEVFEILQDHRDELDQFSTAAFEAGQKTKTWTDAVTALKTALSSGWMKNFELMIGNYEQASEFFSGLIEPLWEIFVTPSNKRTSFFQAAFGDVDTSGAEKAVVNWEKLTEKMSEAGHETSELEEAFRKVLASNQSAKINELSRQYGSLEEAIKSGAVSAEDLKTILGELTGVTTDASQAAVTGAVDAEAALQTYVDAARRALSGEFGNGADRRAQLEAMGLDPDIIEWFTGNLKHGAHIDLEWFKNIAPNKYQEFLNVISNGNAIIDEATGEFIDLTEVVDRDFGKSGRELWQEAVMNIAETLSKVVTLIGEAFDSVFGTPQERGEGVRGWIQRFRDLTEHIKVSDEMFESIREKSTKFFSVFKKFNEVRKAWSPFFQTTLGTALKIVGKVISFVINLITGDKGLFDILSSIPGAIQSVWQKIKPVVDKIKEFFTSDSGFSQLINDIKSLFTTSDNGNNIFTRLKDFLMGTEDAEGVLSKIGRFLGIFGDNSEDVSRSIGNLDESTKNLSTSLTNLTNLGDSVLGVIFGDDEENKEKVSNFVDNITKTLSEKFQGISWSSVLDVGRFAVLGIIVYRLNEFFKNINNTIKAPATGVTAISKQIKAFTGAITGPLNALSTSIKNNEKSNRYLKIAAAIGVLAMSLYLLSKIPQDQFYGAVAGLALLMAIMARMAKNMDGFQLFSNNNKTVSKNNPIQNTIKAFENLKSAFSVDLTNAKFNLNVFNNTMQVLIGIAAVITAVIFAFNKIRDIKSLEEVKPAIIILGGILGAVLLFTGILTQLSKTTKKTDKAGNEVISSSKYLGKVALVMLTMALVIKMIVNAFIKVGEMDSSKINWLAVLTLFGMIMLVMLGIGALLKVSTGFVRQGRSMITSGSAVLAIAAVIMAIGLTVRSLVKSMVKASEIQNLTKGIILIAGLMVALITVFAVMSFLASTDKEGSKGMAKIAASMLILAVALNVLVPAIAALSTLNASGLIAAAAGLAILILGLSVALNTLSSVDPGRLLLVAGVFAIITVFLGLLMAAIATFTATMIGLAQLPWVTLQADFQAMYDVLSPMLPLFLGLGLAATLLGVGCFGAAVAVGVFGLSFVAIAAGIWLVSAALPKLIDGIIYFVQQVQTHAWEIVGFIAIAFGAILAIAILRRAEFLKVMASYVDGIIEYLGKAETVTKILKALAIILLLSIGMIKKLVPVLAEQFIEIIVTLINGIADAIRNNKESIIGAIGNLIGSLIELVFEAIAQLIPGAKKLANKIIKRLQETGAIQPAYALDLENADAVINSDTAEQNAAEAAEEAAHNVSQAAVDGYKTTLNDDFELEDLEHFTDEQIDALLDGNGIGTGAGTGAETENSKIYDSSYEQGEAAASDAKNGFQDGLMNTLGGLTGMTGLGAAGGSPAAGMPGMNVFGSPIGTEGGLATEGYGVSEEVANFLTGTFGGEGVTAMATELGSGTSMDWLTSLTGGLTDPINIENIIGSIQTMMGSTFNSETTRLSFFDSGKNNGDQVIDGITGSMTSEENAVELKTATDTVNDTIKEEWRITSEKNVRLMAENTIFGLIKELMELAEQHLKGVGEQLFYKIQEGYNKAADQHSPSVEMMKEGRFTMLGLIKGIMDESENVYGAGENVAYGLLDQMQSALTSVAAVVDHDFNVYPTVTPVVDLSNVNSAAGVMDSAFAGDYNIAAGVNSSIQNTAASAERVAGSVKSVRSAGNGDAFTFNVYPSEGMDEKALADRVMYRMSDKLQRRRAAIG